MNKTISLVVGAVAVAGLVLGVTAFNRTPSQVASIAGQKGDQGPVGPRGPVGPQGPEGRNGQDGSTKLSAVSGPDTYFPYIANNNLQKYGLARNLTISTSTPCDIVSPAATSTLSEGGVNFRVGSSTTLVITIAKASTGFATSTVLATSTLSANTQGFTNAFATSSVGVDTRLFQNDLVFGPSQHFVVSVSGGVLGLSGNNAANNTNPNFGFQPSGSCSAEFTRI